MVSNAGDILLPDQHFCLVFLYIRVGEVGVEGGRTMQFSCCLSIRMSIQDNERGCYLTVLSSKFSKF